MRHPLDHIEFEAKSIKCFANTGSGFFEFFPITIVIGRNNSGKSSVLDIIAAAVKSQNPLVSDRQMRGDGTPTIEVAVPFSAERLRKNFSNGSSGGPIPGNHWEFAKSLLEEKGIWQFANIVEPRLTGIKGLEEKFRALKPDGIRRLEACIDIELAHLTLLRVAAERSVGPDESKSPSPQPNGMGVTNLVRHFINSDSQPRDLVEVDLLNDLNAIYLGDSKFTSITCQENESEKLWEIFLREEGKGDIRLSESGSSLQSIFIILSYFRLVPKLRELDWKKIILAIEEPENNLHPALLRRLLEFLAHKRLELGFSLIFTSHSPICIDWSARREDSCVIHVMRDGSSSKCSNVSTYDQNIEILNDLDVRGSDILQSNGVIWVEGPSDRIYIRKWIEILTDGELVEGVHYQFMVYGGKVLAHFEALPESESSQLISMITLNRNLAVVIDSDRKLLEGADRKPPMKLNATKRRIRDEVAERGGFSWVTEGKEIENYIPEGVWSKTVGSMVSIDSAYVAVPDLPKIKGISSNKVELASRVVEFLTLQDIVGHLDLEAQLNSLIEHIKRWNSLD